VAQRILSTVVLWVALIAALWLFERVAAVVLIVAISVLTQLEFYAILARTGQRPFRKLGMALGAAMILAPYAARTVFANLAVPDLMPLVLAVAVLLCCIRILYERDPAQRIETLGSTMFGLLYVPFNLHFLLEILFLAETPRAGLLLVAWLVAVAKFCDTGALLVGSAIGRNKMCPSISPKKTWEGAAGGVLVAVGVGTGVAVLFAAQLPAAFTPLVAALAAVPVAAVAILGDLVESMIKRRAEVKDSGGMVPGIGGAFDLSDSLLLAAPVGYLIFTWVCR
jgi:phosphatidate cytidylyltransferase